ncbi:MAG TPA: site-specific DNA-methyltransferase [Solirubrobacteraceae bacterium]|nr:site-specific DNA-methyltransferase [Solirubrobacteraceae bacterium]
MSATTTVSLYEDDTQAWGLIEGDALMTLVKLPDHSIDTVVCDPPYGISFRGEAWDGKDIRQAAGDERLTATEAFQRWTTAWAAQCRRVLKPGGHMVSFGAPRTFHRLVSGIEDGGLEIRDTLMWLYGTGVPKSRRLPEGQGTTLKPAYEPIVLARAPLEGNVQATIDAWDTGALNIDATRIGQKGYWPANLTLSHAPDCPAELIDAGSAGASRLFYCAKASRREREAGCEELPPKSVQIFTGKSRPPRVVANIHPTVKPLSLMRWLVRLITPLDGLVLDPFTGSGSTGIAAVAEDRMFLGIEREAAYVDVACARLTHWAAIAAQREVLP